MHAGAGIKLIEAAARVLAPGGELWTVFNSHLHYQPALERLVGPTREVGRNPKFTSRPAPGATGAARVAGHPDAAVWGRTAAA